MKALTRLSIICYLGFASVCQAQTEPENSKLEKSKNDTTKPMNLLDAQTEIYGQIFEMAGAGAENPLGDATDYLEAIENMDVTEEQKETLRKQYKLYDLSLEPKKKTSSKSSSEEAVDQGNGKKPDGNQ